MARLYGLSPKKFLCKHNELQPFITLIDQILAAKQQPPSSPFYKGELSNTDTSVLEREIDEMVYKLYGLTEEEIKIVEGRDRREGIGGNEIIVEDNIYY